MNNENNNLIIFDGVCNFCNASVNFILKRDKKEKFLFTPMQSNLAKSLMVKYKNGEMDLDTIVLIKNNVFYIRSDAALEIAKDLGGFWFLLRIFKIVPVSIRDFFYKMFAKNRYKLFGKRDVCMIPNLEYKSRFINEAE